jgi:hypothetical protein
MNNDLSRRDMFAAVAMGVAAAGVSQTPAGAAPPLSDFHKAMLMKGQLKQGMHVSSLTGTFYAVEGGTTTALHGAVMSSFTKNRMLADGSIEAKTIEVEWYTSLDGEVMESWTNPFTGKTVPVAQMNKYFVNTIVYKPDGTRRSTTFGDLVYEKVLGWREDGDDIWMYNQLSSRNFEPDKSAQGPTGGREFVATELATYHARRSEFYQPGITRVRSESYHSCTGEFRPWQQMGNHPGYQLLLVSNRSLEHADELPALWLAHTAKRFPELLRSPEALLDA